MALAQRSPGRQTFAAVIQRAGAPFEMPATMRSMTKRMALIGAVLISPVAAGAWEVPTGRAMARQALRMMPQSLQSVLEQHQPQLFEALELGQAAADRLAAQDSDLAADRIAAASFELQQLMQQRGSFSEVAQRLGQLGALVLAVNDPTHYAGASANERAAFLRQVERSRERFPFVFDGHGAPELRTGDVQHYMRVSARRARFYGEQLRSSYFVPLRGGREVSFDPRSMPFGIASIAYSHAISDLVRIWFYSWRAGGGDVTRTPFYRRE